MGLSWFIKCWLVPTVVLLGISRLMILTVTFKRLAPLLGIPHGVEPWIPLLDSKKEARARQISLIILLSAKLTPWESNCYPQAITAGLLLRLFNIPYNLFFGLNSNPINDDMKAHAWVAAGRIRVTGGGSFRHFTVVQSFGTFLLDPESKTGRPVQTRLNNQ
jgi:hypothetical protein